MNNKRDLLSLNDLSSDEIKSILSMAEALKKKPYSAKKVLAQKNIGLVFQKPSNRTRVSFEVGIDQMGGNCVYLGPHEINLGIRESTEDVAKTLTRYLDGIIARTNSHEIVSSLAKNSTVPLINGLCDIYHPCQGLTDLFSIQEKFGRLEGLTLAYVGDGNNVAHSLILGCSKVGMNIVVATPDGYGPHEDVIKQGQTYAKESNAFVTITNSPLEAVQGAHVIYSDVWISMGQEEESKKRVVDFKDFQINAEMVSYAAKDYIFMHCLPAHRDLEVTADVIDGSHSIVFDQAENRLHTQKAILKFLFSG